MSSDATRPSESFRPALYGQACAGCSRAKCKCFYRAEGSACERCHRLGKACEPAAASRKRKAPASPLARPTRVPTRSLQLEEKLDDLVSLLRSQAVGKQQTQPPQSTPLSTRSASSVSSNSAAHVPDSYSSASASAGGPDIVIDTASSVVHLQRPAHSSVASSPIFDDVSAHKISVRTAEEQLDRFRCMFLPIFPFVYIPSTTSASDLHRQKPFLWLVIMSLTTKTISQQFAAEGIIWSIISQRVVSQQIMDLDLLLGLICFASWSHYFKKEKPFMTMLSQLAVSVAYELGLHVDTTTTQPSKFAQTLIQQPAKQHHRTLEERRSIVALFHLTFDTWAAYRKTEPLRWTPYMNNCLRILGEGNETDLDIHLVSQIKCQLITTQLTCTPSEWSTSTILVSALTEQLKEVRQSLPAHILSDRTTQFYIINTELTIQESLFSRPRSQSQDPTGLSRFRRLQDLDSILTNVERWFAALFDMPFVNWVGINVDIFTQLTHCLVVLFKLSSLEETGWDLNEVRGRADIFDIVDRICETIELTPVALGIVETTGPRKSLFVKSICVFKTIKALFSTRLAPRSIPGAVPTPDSGNGLSSASNQIGEISASDYFPLNFSDEPWLLDFLEPTWDFRLDY